MLQNMFNQPTQSTSTIPSISGVKFNKPQGWVDEYGGNGELTGQSQWGNYFSGLENLGEGYSVEDVIGQGYAGVGGAPSSFTIRRADPNGNKNVYQQRTLNVNPDGTVSWGNGSDWQSVTQQSQMDHFLNAGLPMALAFTGAMGATGGLGGLFGGAEGLSGMDLAADAALGTGNNVMTAGAGLGSGATTAGGVGSMFSNATNPALIESAVGTPGYGMSSAGLGAATSGGGTMDFLKDLGKSIVGGQGGGISNLGNLASLFSNYKQYSNTGDLMDDIRSIYSPDGVYAKELEKQLARRDAAAGRNSQYGPRLAELMARLGDSQARSLSGLGGMMQTQQGGLNGMLGAGQRVLEGTGILDKLFSIFGD